MELGKVERLILSNQYLILENLYPEQAHDYALRREIIESGYSFLYNDHVYNDLDDYMTEDKYQEVNKILDMYLTIKTSFDKLDEKENQEEIHIKFGGFDANHEIECQYLKLARFIVNKQRRFCALSESIDNSHCQMLARYRQMLSKWQEFPNKYSLSADNIRYITE